MPSVITAFRDLERARQIAVVLARHGFGEVLHRLGLDSFAPAADVEEARSLSLARRLRLVLQDLGPSFVKLGQIASTRADLLPGDVIDELKVLQDDVRPVAWEAVRAELEAELGGDLGDVFASVDERPLASASIAQVHRATLREGALTHDVAVKVQRPGIREVIARDVDLLYWFARALERAMPETRRYSPSGLVAEFDRSIQAELDFVQEAEHAERFARNFEGDPAIRFPRVYRAQSGKRVLVMEFFPGQRLNDAMTTDRVDRKTLARNAIRLLIKMVFDDGFFHADPHPGNIIVLGTPEAPVIGLLDLGLVGHLSGPMRDRALDMMVAAVREDFDAVADALLALGRPTRKVDQEVFRADVAVLGRKYLGRPLGEIEIAALVRDLIWGAIKHGIDMPADFLLVGRALMTMEGTGRQLDPALDIFSEAKPYFLKLLAKRYAPDKLTVDLVKSVLRVSGLAQHMPDQVAEILEDLRKGHLTLKSSDPGLPAVADRLGRRLYAGLTVASLVVGGAVLAASGPHAWVGYGLLAVAALVAAGHGLLEWWRALGLRR